MPGLLDIFESILNQAGQAHDKGRSAGGNQPSSSRRTNFPQLDPLPEPGRGGVGDVMKSVVQIIAMRQGFMGGMTSAWTGSGTIVHPQGIILTNCHVANPRAMGMSSPPADRLGIALTERSDRAPALSYFAEVIGYDADLDLAVMRITHDVKGKPTGRLKLPSVALGDSDTLELGDRLSIFGYPGIGGETITFTSGDVSGFSQERGVNASRAWVKTDATIAGGNSGGTSVNDNGRLVGIPTQAAAGSGVTPVDARPVLDTNRDGRVDQRDTPMAIGGFINGLRPVNLAIPLLKEAGMRISSDRTGDTDDLPGRTVEPIRHFDPSKRKEKPTFSNLLFSTQVTSDGRPINPTHSVPAGVDEVYASFDYDNLSNGTPWSAVWMNDGEVIIEQLEDWDDGDSGRKTVKISNRRGVPNGEYQLVVGIRGEVALEGKMMVGKLVDESDAEVSGRLVDMASDRPINNGLVIVVKPNVALRSFLKERKESDVVTSTESDSNGRFKLPDQLPKGMAYSLVVAAAGYKPLTVQGGLRIGPGAPEQADMGDVALTRS